MEIPMSNRETRAEVSKAADPADLEIKVVVAVAAQVLTLAPQEEAVEVEVDLVSVRDCSEV